MAGVDIEVKRGILKSKAPVEQIGYYLSTGVSARGRCLAINKLSLIYLNVN
jgi:hypothetical protein